VDWHLQVLKERYDLYEENKVAVHASVARHRAWEDRPLTLRKCLDAFTAEETVEEAFCSRCRAHRRARLKADVWRAPPVLVVHLKRFQFDAYSRRKLRNVVTFPIHDFDLAPWIVSGEAGEATKKDQGIPNFKVTGVELEDVIFEDSKPESSEQVNTSGSIETDNKKDDSPPSVAPKLPPKLSSMPSIGGVLSAGTGADDGLYELYAVVHHVGALQSGHYVASVRSLATGKWHNFNDNQVTEMADETALGGAPSAYLLFYVRKGLGALDIADVYPAQAQSGSMTLEEIEELMSKRDSSGCTTM